MENGLGVEVAKSSVSLFLIRKGFDEVSAFKDEEELNDLKAIKFELDNKHEVNGVGYICVTDTKLPDWLRDFKSWCAGSEEDVQKNIDKFLKLEPKSISGAILINEPSTKRLFIISYGRGRKLVNDDAIERNFGRNFALNSTSEKKIISLRRQAYEGMPWFKESQASGVSEIHLFDINCEYEILKKITSELDVEIPKELIEKRGKKKVKLIGDKTTGKDSLHLNAELTLKQMIPLCKWTYKEYKKTAYKDLIKNIDSIQEVKDRLLLEVLNGELINQVTSADLDKLRLIIPDLVNHEDYNNFRMIVSKTEYPIGETYEISNYIELLMDSNTFPKGVSRLKQDKVLAYDGNKYLTDWTVLKCLSTEVEHQGEHYILMDGDWFQFEKGFLNGVVSRLDKLVVFNKHLDPWDGTSTEAIFNKNQAASKGYKCVDAKCATTNLGGKVEPCDLFVKDNHFIHVKKGTSSSDLSHLFSQAYVSAELVHKKDEKFLNDFTNNNFKNAERLSVLSKLRDRNFDVTIAILNKNKADFEPSIKIKNLPIFSIINLNRVVDQIEQSQQRRNKIYIEFVNKAKEKPNTVIRKKKT